jgi:formylglycine-generating enzyme required for sulfatase activity
MDTDSTLTPPPDTLHVGVSSLDGGVAYRDADYRLADPGRASGGTVSLPTSLVIESNGNPQTSIAIDLSVWSGGTPRDVRHYRVIGVPTTFFEEYRIVFSDRCLPWAALDDAGVAVSTCPVGTTCNPLSGECEGDILRGDAGVVATDATTMEADGDAQASSDDAAPPGDRASAPDADAGCTPDARQCRDLDTPQRCTPEGLWQDQASCSSLGPSYCYGGVCIVPPPSCLAAGDKTECQSFEVPGGMYYRSDDSLHPDLTAPATVSPFRLDALEVDVGRFRRFVNAVVLDGWLPQRGSGKHDHLGGGEGLRSGGSGVTVTETGWDSAWDVHLPPTAAEWNANLWGCFAPAWTPSADANERDPINCITWYEGYAFCIWDDAFLPSEAEWNYAAAAGRQQRLYPWGDADPGVPGDYANYGCVAAGTGRCADPSALQPVGTIAAGIGLFGQLDLAGNVAEWTLDVYAPYSTPCTDCAGLGGSTQRVFRGGGYDRGVTFLYTSSRVYGDPAGRYADVGVRCARTP